MLEINSDDSNVGRTVLAVIVLTLITAGSLVERKWSFTLLRVSSVSLVQLYKVILLEAALPLIGGSIAAALLPSDW